MLTEFVIVADPMACSHHRAPDYFAESIRSLTGFWGWKCESYIYYLLGFCPHNNHQVVAGEDCIVGTEGMFMITTNADSPFAIGRWTDAMGLLKTPNALNKFSLKRDPFISDIDQWGKLEGNFNNVEQLPTPYSQDPNGDDWPYFNHIGTNKLTKDYIKKIIEQDNDRYEESTEDNAAAHLNLLKHAGMSNAINQNEGLSDFRKRLQLKEASVVEQYSSPMYNPF